MSCNVYSDCFSLGLEDADDGQCLMTRLEQGGLVSDLKKFNKIDPKMVSNET